MKFGNGGQQSLAEPMTAHQSAIIQGTVDGATSVLIDLYACHPRPVNGYPAEWANTQGELGEALEKLFALTKEKSLFLRAIACFEAAIRGYTVCGLTDEAEAMRKRADDARKTL